MHAQTYSLPVWFRQASSGSLAQCGLGERAEGRARCCFGLAFRNQERSISAAVPVDVLPPQAVAFFRAHPSVEEHKKNIVRCKVLVPSPSYRPPQTGKMAGC